MASEQLHLDVDANRRRDIRHRVGAAVADLVEAGERRWARTLADWFRDHPDDLDGAEARCRAAEATLAKRGPCEACDSEGVWTYEWVGTDGSIEGTSTMPCEVCQVGSP